MQSWAFLRSNRLVTFVIATVLICMLGALDAILPRGIPMALGYILPIALLGAVCNRKQLAIAAAFCMFVSERTDAYSWNLQEGIARDLFTFAALLAVGLYVGEFFRKQDLEVQHVAALEEENLARVQAEEQLSLLIGNSPLAILTTTDEGVVLQANESAQRVFTGGNGVPESLKGRKIEEMLPALSRVLARSARGLSMRTMLQVQGLRTDGEPFLAEVWFSNYNTSAGERIAAMVLDISEEFRTREESISAQLLDSSRLVVGAMAHEMRNVVAAVQVMQQSLLAELPKGIDTPSLIPMTELVSTLATMASSQLSHVKRNAVCISLSSFLAELQVIAQTILSEDGITLAWDVPKEQPSVWADADGLMQVFLNLIRNAKTALAHTPEPSVRIQARQSGAHVQITITDNGPGVANPSALFRPFQESGPVSGLGLYLARAILTSFRGHIQNLPSDTGAAFEVVLEVVLV